MTGRLTKLLVPAVALAVGSISTITLVPMMTSKTNEKTVAMIDKVGDTKKAPSTSVQSVTKAIGTKVNSGSVVGLAQNSSGTEANAEVEKILKGSATFSGKAHVMAMWWAYLKNAKYSYNQIIGMLANVKGEATAGQVQYSRILKDFYGPGKDASTYGNKLVLVTTEENIKCVMKIAQNNNPSQIGFGSCQWTSPGYVKMFAEEYDKALKNGIDLNTEDGRVAAEINVFPRWMAAETSGVRRWKNTSNVYDSAYIFCVYIERPGSSRTKGAQRGNWAKELDRLLKNVG